MTRLITRGVMVLRLQDVRVFQSEVGLVCRAPPKTIVVFNLTEDRESCPPQIIFTSIIISATATATVSASI